MTQIDVTGWAKRNLWPLSDGSVAVRPGIRDIYSAVANRTIVAGFSLIEPNTGEGWHYIVDVDSQDATAADTTIRVYDENWVLLQAYATGSDVTPEVVTYGVLLDFLTISSPSFDTVFGFVGGGLIKALKQSSINTGTTAIEVPRGLCVAWASSRIVMADGTSVYISDPVTALGGDPRTFVAENQIVLPDVIRGLHVSSGGALIMVTERGVYSLSEQAAAVGQIPVGDLQKVTDYEAQSLGSTVTAHGRVFGLTQKGFRLVDMEGAEEQLLDDPMMPVGHGVRIQSEDYRRMCKAYPGQRGPVFSYPHANAVHMVDLGTGVRSWWTFTHSGEGKVVGVLRERDGDEILLTEAAAYRVVGNHDGVAGLTEEAAAVKGFYLGRIQSPVQGSPVIRRLDVASDTGSNVLGACRGEDKTSAPTQRGAVIGTAVWGTDAETEAAVQSAQFRFSTRTDDISLEAGAEQPLSRVDPGVYLEVRGPGKKGRP